MKIEDKTKLIDSKETTAFYVDPIKYYGCGEEFEITVRDNPYEIKKKYCAICFGNIYGLKTFEKILKQFTPIMQTAWKLLQTNCQKKSENIFTGRIEDGC